MAWMVSRLRGLRRRALGLDRRWGFGGAGCRGVHAGKDKGSGSEMAGGGFDLTTFSRLYGGWFQTAPWLRHGAGYVGRGFTWVHLA